MEQVAERSDRRRSRRAHEAILAAAADLLDEQGFSAVTIEAIAARAGVGKQTIYRWWPSKAAVVMEAYLSRSTERSPVPDTGAVRVDLHRYLLRLFSALETPATRSTFAGLIAESRRDPELAGAFRDRFVSARRRALHERLEQGRQRGELRGDFDVEVALDLLSGAVWYRLLLDHAPLDRRFAAELVDQLLRGLTA